MKVKSSILLSWNLSNSNFLYFTLLAKFPTGISVIIPEGSGFTGAHKSAHREHHRTLLCSSSFLPASDRSPCLQPLLWDSGPRAEKGKQPFPQLLCPISFPGPWMKLQCLCPDQHTVFHKKRPFLPLSNSLSPRNTKRTSSSFIFQDSFHLECNWLTFHLDLYLQAATFSHIFM